ncbi:MAG TPA: lipase family protein [Pirellulaceae bacterium]|nr:lipase family protein [Pirellulaceae bacterium]
MLNPLALSRGCHYLENALRLATLAELAYRNDPAKELLPFADHFRRIQAFSLEGTFGFVVSDEQNLVVALRGTDQVIDWVTNLTTTQMAGMGGWVHDGFYHALNIVWNDILTRVQALRDNGQTVWVTGHSLGGALATIAAARLTEAGIEPYITCTFGAPRCLDPKAAASYLPRLYRFVNKGDLVPTVPPALSLPWNRYQHTGSLSITLDKDRTQAAKTDSHDQNLLTIARWFFSPSFDIQKNITQTLINHAMKSYIALIKDELGPETVERLEQGRILPFTGATRIKPRRALAA